MRIFTIVFVIGFVWPAMALEMKVERVYVDEFGSASAIVSVKNDDEPRGYSIVGIRCAWFNKGQVVATSGGIVTNLAYGDTGYTEPGKPLNGQPIDSGDCRVSYATPN